MQVTVFASGSSGNCLLLSDGSDHILIDAGISLRRIEGALRQAGLSMKEIGGVLITHEHSDHISGLETMARRFDTPFFAPRTVSARLRGRFPALENRFHTIPVGEEFSIGGLRVTAFHTCHDTDESVGFRIRGSGIYAHATDTGCVNEEILSFLLGADTVLLESNHDLDMLRFGPYPVALKRRILSSRGHLSNEDCARTALTLAHAGTSRIILGHLSRENNTPAKAMTETGQALLGTDTELYCAPPLGFLQVPVGKEKRGEEC